MFNIRSLLEKALIGDFIIIGFDTFSFNLVNQKEISGVDTSLIDFSKYRITVKLSKEYVPRFFMTTPIVKKDCKHINGDGSLCLYHKSEFQWYNTFNDGERIILVLYSWILYYDLWLTHKVWYGDEFPHN